MPIHGYVDMFIMGLLLFSIVLRFVFNREVMHSQKNHQTLFKYIDWLSKHVERKIKKLQPQNFALNIYIAEMLRVLTSFLLLHHYQA